MGGLNSRQWLLPCKYLLLFPPPLNIYVFINAVTLYLFKMGINYFCNSGYLSFITTIYSKRRGSLTGQPPLWLKQSQGGQRREEHRVVHRIQEEHYDGHIQ